MIARSLAPLAVVTVSCLLSGWSLVSAQSFRNGYYTIVGPRVLRPNSEYHVAVTAVEVGQPTTVLVEVGGKQDSGGVFKTSQFVAVEPYHTRIIKLEIGDVGPGQYNLTAQGTGGINFHNTSALEYVHKSFSVFIQTDKAIYKPGHKVLFRAIVLNSHLKPSVTGTLDIHVTDGKGNRVRQWNRVLTTRGVFTGELELSQSPVLGDWNITVTVLDQMFHKTFQVAEYVLPKFEVTIDVPKHATFKDSKVVATVRAKYTYGRNVKGEATVTAYPQYYSSIIQPVFHAPVRKVIPIDGKVTAEFDLVKELNLKDESYERPIQIDVTVEEALTGRRQNNSATIIVHKHKYKMELIKTSEYFKPGLKYVALMKVSTHDGIPVTDRTNPVKVAQGYSYNSDEFNKTNHMLDSNGLIELVYYPPLHNVTTLGIEAEYLDLKEWFSMVTAAVSPSNSFIQAVVKTEKPMVNQDIEIEVNSTAGLKYITYEVFGRGDVITAGTVSVSLNQKTVSLRFLATYAMAPVAHLIVQYVRDDGEVVADALDIELNGIFQNFVDIDAGVEETQPGSNIELKVQSKPNSYIGVLGIDQSVLLLKKGNDISQDDVLNELYSYDNGEMMKFLPFMKEAKERGPMSWWPGTFTAEEAFEKSGAIIMTNAYVHEYHPGVYFRSNIAEDDLFSAENLAPISSIAQAGAPGSNPSESVRIRSKFPETWIWELLETGFDGKAQLHKTVPDTITSWVISAFSVDSIHGLGLIETPRKMRVFRPFFVSLDLPYSVIRGEIVSIPVVVFNYMDKDVTADVTIENSGQFEFADYSNDVNDQPKVEFYRNHKLTVRANSGATTSFMITPKELGYIDIKITAKSALAGDGVQRKLLVKAEGETQYLNKAIFIDLRRNSTFNTKVDLNIPANVVPGSEHIEVSAVGDILGPSIQNLASLIKMPYGCGEQNMLNFVPNIVILEYLQNTHQLRPAIESKAKRYTETGYQQELTYRHEDGSFSAFGSADKSGSTWLTAFVVKSFRQASPFVAVEEKIIMEALQWLANTQSANGSFPEVGQVSHADMQGGSAHGLALTAYTLLAFLENQRATPAYRNTVNKATDYIVRNLPGLDDPYALAICAYALHLAQHPDKEVAFNLLEAKAQHKDEMTWWRKEIKEADKKNPWIQVPNSVDVEMTAYGLLTYVQRGLTEEAFPIVKWLISQQNDQGGFASTQDTVIALGALAKLASTISTSSSNVKVDFGFSKGAQNTSIGVNKENAMILQKYEVPKKVRSIEVSASGSGFVVAQVSYRFNVNVTGAWPLFSLDPQVDKNSDKNHLQLSICSGFRGGNASNMAVMEVSLPSGFTVDSDALPSLQQSKHVKRVETKHGDTVVVLYFDKMTAEEYCPTVSAFRTHKVAMQKPVPVTVYDYYDQTRRARVFYEPRVATRCDICEDADCQRVCSGKLGSQSTDDKGGGAASKPHLLLLVLAVPLAYLRF
ncbi:CD109 antigen isoform X2 [Nilaparvata lugens]|uniref:CD109 antigen isoform X2 n=1 Tax=Nilaparvata lugens TaxID=108931 RepID=UPI00193C88C5|nr:CD109 antigen isoform X2 [Nilaparvata lugens]